MGTFSIWHWLIVLAVVLVLFGGGGKIPRLMKDLGAGINQFKKGLKESEKSPEDGDGEAKALEQDRAASTVTGTGEEEKKAANG